jgi:hypothetical protein
VYKNGYLLFVKNFWGVASQRTRFFNMKINLRKIGEGRGQEMLPMAGWIKVSI